MDATPFYPPTYFPASYFYSAPAPPASTGLMPYNAPTYFAPTYFYGPSPSTTTGLMPYNAPTYFAPTYFYGPSATAGNVPVAPTPQPSPAPSPPPDWCEQEPYSALLALIEATGMFEEVIFGTSAQRGQAGADTYPLAVLTPRGWQETDEVDPTSIVRIDTFSIAVVVASQDALPQFDRLDRLSCVIKKAVDGSGLGGTCLPALTRIRSGHYADSNHYPEQSIELQGEFATLIDPTTHALALS